MSKKFIVIIIVIFLILVSGGFFLGKDDIPPNDEDMRLPAIEVAPEDNAYYDFTQAADKIYFPGENTELINNIIRGKEWDAQFVEKLIKENEETFFYVDKALFRRQFQFPEFQDPEKVTIDTPLPPMGAYRNIAKLISIKALYLFNQGKEREAFDEAMKIIKLSQLIEDSPRPILIQLLVASAMKETGLERLRFMITETTLSSTILKSYAKELANFRANKLGVKTILKAEYITIVNELEKTPREEILGMAMPFHLKLMAKIPFYYKPNQTKKLFLEEFRNQIKNFDKNYYSEIKPFYVQPLIPDSFVKRLSTENLIGKTIYMIMMIDYSDVFSIKCQKDFSIIGTQLLIALRSHKIEKGEIPDSLDELVPNYISEIPKDPFDGNPIRFSATKKIIYSVGKDLEDSGGSEGENWREMKDPTLKIEF